MSQADPRTHFLNLLQSYLAKNPQDQPIIQKFRAFVLEHQNCFHRELLVGHVTASAWVLNPTYESVLLLHHKKLCRWLQPGGHCDGDGDTLAVARKELLEETGLDAAKLLHDGIFDLDIHQIPQRGNVVAHLHYDVRYCFAAPEAFNPRCSDESNSVSWISLAKLQTISDDESVLRMAAKTRAQVHQR